MIISVLCINRNNFCCIYSNSNFQWQLILECVYFHLINYTNYFIYLYMVHNRKINQQYLLNLCSVDFVYTLFLFIFISDTFSLSLYYYIICMENTCFFFNVTNKKILLSYDVIVIFVFHTLYIYFERRFSLLFSHFYLIFWNFVIIIVGLW